MVSNKNHYSYTVYADPATARTFDDRRFGGPIGALIAEGQARVLAGIASEVRERKVLDVGTGTGRVALLLARDGADVTALDASSEMLATARRRASESGARINFVLGDAHALDFADRTFEVAVSFRVLMHTPKWRTCVAELCRVSERLVVLDYPSRRSVALMQSAGRQLAAAVGWPTEAYRVLSHRQVSGALEESGFRVTAIHRQFVLPIALHKAIGSRRFTVATERLLDRAGLLNILGSPVTIVAERCARS